MRRPSLQASPDAKLNDLKALLGRMLFSGTAMEKKVGEGRSAAWLSCGVRGRQELELLCRVDVDQAWPYCCP